jgi:hypothetical protein
VPVRFDAFSGVEQDIAEETSALLLGSLAVAVPGAMLGYVLFLYVWRRFDLHLPRRADEGLSEASGQDDARG